MGISKYSLRYKPKCPEIGQIWQQRGKHPPPSSTINLVIYLEKLITVLTLNLMLISVFVTDYIEPVLIKVLKSTAVQLCFVKLVMVSTLNFNSSTGIYFILVQVFILTFSEDCLLI